MHVRKRHCAECPYRGDWVPEKITELIEGWPDTHNTPCELLCVADMENEKKSAYTLCRGFAENAARLGLR